MQVERADLIVLNKMDLVADDGAAVEGALRALNDVAPVLRAVQAEVAWEVILDVGVTPRTAGVPEDPTYHHHPSYESCSVAVPGVVDEVALEDFVERLPVGVFRVKGIVATNAEWPWTLLNAVAGRVDLRPIDPQPVPAVGQLVFIGRDLDREGLARGCAALERVQT
jgi:G3E family GTPase